jgi:hypothetical protein
VIDGVDSIKAKEDEIEAAVRKIREGSRVADTNVLISELSSAGVYHRF